MKIIELIVTIQFFTGSLLFASKKVDGFSESSSPFFKASTERSLFSFALNPTPCPVFCYYFPQSLEVSPWGTKFLSNFLLKFLAFLYNRPKILLIWYLKIHGSQYFHWCWYAGKLNSYYCLAFRLIFSQHSPYSSFVSFQASFWLLSFLFFWSYPKVSPKVRRICATFLCWWWLRESTLFLPFYVRHLNYWDTKVQQRSWNRIQVKHRF